MRSLANLREIWAEFVGFFGPGKTLRRVTHLKATECRNRIAGAINGPSPLKGDASAKIRVARSIEGYSNLFSTHVYCSFGGQPDLTTARYQVTVSQTAKTIASVWFAFIGMWFALVSIMGEWGLAGFGAVMLVVGAAFIVSMRDERKADEDFLVSYLDHMLEAHPPT